ncbi:MAG: AAA family ATPase [Treponema sp.]|nr:AAA family ATPase [Treponema sp.]
MTPLNGAVEINGFRKEASTFFDISIFEGREKFLCAAYRFYAVCAIITVRRYTMGIYLNPGNDLFKECLNSKIYVDKSALIGELNQLLKTSGKFLCVSRPRRFGKTMAGAMISAYYSKGCDSAALFAPLKISGDKSFSEHLNKYNVIQFDINTFYKRTNGSLDMMNVITSTIVAELIQEFPAANIAPNDTLENAIIKAWGATGETFVIIMDEYDVLVREKVSKPLFDKYLDFLSSLFKNSTLKPAIALAYLTGILPIVRDKIQSKMNEFDEYSMLSARQFSEFTGFTEDEVRSLCAEYQMDFDECRRWYDGYRMSDTISVYSPKSMVTAMLSHEYAPYWTKTASYESLKLFILMDFEGIRADVVTMIGGGRVRVNVFKYLNTFTDFYSKDDVFTYLIHLGYLSYDRSAQECFIPNKEIRSEWINSIEDEADYKEIMEMVNGSRELLERTLQGDEEYVAAELDKAHTRATNPLTYNNEASFQSAIGLAYFYANAKYTVIKELPTGKGYADVAFVPYVPNIPAVIVELKNAKSAGSAIAQIKERKYDELLQHYRGDLLFVGINYSPDTKKHECKIEKVLMS